MYSAMLRIPPFRITTSLDVLRYIVIDDSVRPSGFIFHIGRCGSTLLAKALARSRMNIVFGEAAPHNLFWKLMPRLGGEAIDLYRRLVLAMGRPRLPSYRSHFIKFSSWNILQFATIRAAFPDTPALFLFRQPSAVLASSQREAQPWLGVDVGLGRIWTDAAAATLDLGNAALAIRDSHFRCLDYAAITPGNLRSILRFFQVESPPRGELALMQSEFFWDSKSGRVPQPFAPRETPPIYTDPLLTEVYCSLVERSQTDWGQQL